MERHVDAERDHDRIFRDADSTINTAFGFVQKRDVTDQSRVAELDRALSAVDGFGKDVKDDHQKLFKKKEGSVIASAFGFQDLPRFKTANEGEKKIEEEEGDRESVWDFEEDEADDDDRSVVTAAQEWTEFASYNGPSMFQNLRKKQTTLRPLRDPNAPKSRFAVSEVYEEPKKKLNESVETWVVEEGDDWFKEETTPAAATESRSVTLFDALPKTTPTPMYEPPAVSPVAHRPALSPKPVAFGNASFNRASPSSSMTGLPRSAVSSGSKTLLVKPREVGQYPQLRGAVHSSSSHSGNSSFGSFRPGSASTWNNNSSATSGDRLEKNQEIRLVPKESDRRGAFGNEEKENKKDSGAVSVSQEFLTNLDAAMKEMLLTHKVTAETRSDMEDVHNAIEALKKVPGAIYRLFADDQTMTYLKAQHPGIYSEAKKFVQNK